MTPELSRIQFMVIGNRKMVGMVEIIMFSAVKSTLKHTVSRSFLDNFILSIEITK